MKKIALLAAFALGLLLVLVFWRSREGDAATSALTAAGVEKAALRTPEEPLVADATADARAAVAALEHEPAAAPEAGKPARAMQVVRVVDRSTGAPVAGAEVLGLRVTDIELVRLRTSTAPGTRRIGPLEARLEREGERARTDEHGIARLSRGGGSLAIIGKAPGLFGFGAGPGDLPGELRLELAPDISLEVEVVDAAGAPVANVPVALRLNTGPAPEHEEPVLTDDAGRASVPHVLLPRAGPRVLSVGVAAVLPEPVERPLDLSALPTEPVRLVLPATGSLEVLVRTRDGASAGDGNVHLVLAPAAAASGGPAAGAYKGEARARMIAGRVLFPHVALGAELRLKVQPDSSLFSTGSYVCEGPTRAGERRTLEVVAGIDYPTIRMRVLDEAGLPLRDARLRLVLGPPGKLPGGMHDQARTDGDGTLTMGLYAGFPGPGPGPWRLMVVQPPGEGSPARDATLELAPRYEPGVHELADLHLRPVPLLAAGVVVDPLGQPLGGADLMVQVFDPDGRFGNPASPQWRWTGLMTQTDEDGAFALHGELPPARIAVHVRFPGLSEARFECERGARDLRVEMPATGTIAGRLVVDPKLQEERISIRAQLVSVGGLPPDPVLLAAPLVQTAQPRRDGSFSLAELAGGHWSLTVLLPGRGLELHKVEGLEVRPGETLRDPRLDPLDLRGALVPVTIELVVPPGGPALAGFCEWRETGATAGPARVPPEEGRVRLFVRGAPVEVGCAFLGYRPVRLEGVLSDQRVVLAPGLDLRLRLPEGLRLPEAPARLTVELLVAAPLGSDLASRVLTFDAQGELALRACGPGSARVRLRVEPKPGMTRGARAVGPEWRQLELVESSREQAFVLDVTQAQIDAALAELSR